MCPNLSRMSSVLLHGGKCANWFREEFPAPSSIPSGLEKVFCIAQLLVRYLLHSQERLTEALESVQASNRSMTEVSGFVYLNNNNNSNNKEKGMTRE